MRTRCSLIVSCSIALASCGEAGETANTGSDEETETAALAEDGGAAPTAAGEPGSGRYAADCAASEGGYQITIAKGAEGFMVANVVSGSNTYDDLLTSYSFMGDATPAEFEIAVMFDTDNSPVPIPQDDGPRIELWKGEAGYYALVNGDKDQRLMSCGA